MVNGSQLFDHEVGYCGNPSRLLAIFEQASAATAGARTDYGARRTMAEKVRLNAAAPNFALDDFKGHRVRLSDFRNKRHVVLVLNRGFI
jgi:hypothetical protein